MADQTHPVSPPSNKRESMTTREEMDFEDNDHEQETGRVSPLGHDTLTTTNNKPVKTSPSPKPRVSFQDQDDEIPPTKPPRPQSPQQQAENTLIEAFPSIDTKVVKAVLMASGGKVEPAFNALLAMTDPDFNPEEAAPPQPPRPAQRQQQQQQSQQQPRQPRNQLEADEMYARQLAEHFNSQGPDQGAGQQTRYNQRERQGPNQQRPRYDEEDREHSFFDDDLPEIGRNIQRGFAETQKQVNSWITTFKKRIDGDDEDEDLYSGSSSSNARPARQNFGPSQTEQMYGIRKSAEHAPRRSVEQQRYDSDPHVLDDSEFSRLELRDDEAPPAQPPRTSSRLPTNPDLFKPQPKPPQSGPVDEVDAFDRNNPSSTPNNNPNAKKWQPLTSVAPAPEEDNDPFALGDDDDDINNSKTDDLRKEDTERLKNAARASISAGSGEGAKLKPTLSESEQSGTKNKDAEELLSGAGKKE
ncbi:hypothetical protein Q7P36_003387 [Cladosporium allicinum]